MTTENSTTQMRKGILEYCVLLIIAREEVYASDLIDEMKQAKIIVVEGTLYPLLNRLQRSGHLTYSWKESNAGPPRKYFTLSDAGSEYLQTQVTAWDEMIESVNTIRNSNKQSHE